MEARLVKRFLDGEGIVLNKNTHVFKPLDFRIKKVLNRVFIFARYEILYTPDRLSSGSEAAREFIHQIENAYELVDREWIDLADQLTATLERVDGAGFNLLIQKIRLAKERFLTPRVEPPVARELTLSEQVRVNPEMIFSLSTSQIKEAALAVLDVLASDHKLIGRLKVTAVKELFKNIPDESASKCEPLIRVILSLEPMLFFDLSLAHQLKQEDYAFMLIQSYPEKSHLIPLEVIALLEPKLKHLIMSSWSYCSYFTTPQLVVLKNTLIEKLHHEPHELAWLRHQFVISCYEDLKPIVKRLKSLEYLSDEIQLLFQDEIVSGLVNHQFSLQVVSARIQVRHSDEVLLSLKTMPSEWKFVVHEVKEEILDQFLDMIRADHSILKCLSSKEQIFHKAFITSIISEDKQAVRYLYNLQDQFLDLVLEVLEPDETDVSWVNIWNVSNQEFLFNLVHKNFRVIQRISPIYQSDRLILEAIDQDPSAYTFTGVHLDSDLKGRALEKNWQLIKFLNKEDLENTEDNSAFISYLHRMLRGYDERLLATFEAFNHLKLKHFLATHYLEAKAKSRLGELLCESLTDITPKLLTLILGNWTDATLFETDLEAAVKSLKPALLKKGQVRQAFLELLFSLEHTSFTSALKAQIFMQCLGLKEPHRFTPAPLDEVLLRLSLFENIISSRIEFSFLSQNYTSKLMLDSITASLTSRGLLSASHQLGFFNSFLSSRHPSGIFTYVSRIGALVERHESLKLLIGSISSGTFYETRRSLNSYRDIMLPYLESWDKGKAIAVTFNSKSLNVIDTDNWQDLFFCGTEVENSCQRLDGNGEYNQGLLGYMLDGKIRMLCVKETPLGQVQARALIKIMVDPHGKPCLFLEKTYPFASAYENLIFDFAKQRGQEIGLDVYVRFFGEDPIIVEVSSTKLNAAGVEYSDGVEGHFGFGAITDGIYSIQAVKI